MCYVLMVCVIFTECEGVRHGRRETRIRDDVCLQVRPPSHLLYSSMRTDADENAARRDPGQHSELQSEIEEQSSAMYSTARLWDDGIIRPTDTRDVVGLGLALVARERGAGAGRGGSATWDGDAKGFGVFRM